MFDIIAQKYKHNFPLNVIFYSIIWTEINIILCNTSNGAKMVNIGSLAKLINKNVHTFLSQVDLTLSFIFQKVQVNWNYFAIMD